MGGLGNSPGRPSRAGPEVVFDTTNKQIRRDYREVNEMDKNFIKEDAKVYYLHPECTEEPVRTGTVEATYEDDSADVWDDALGTVNVDFRDIFETKADAEKALG